MSKKNKKKQLWIGLGLVIVSILLITLAMVSAMKGEETGDVTVAGEVKVTGLMCEDRELIHPSFTSVPMVSHFDTMTANFRDNRLSSISLLYEGSYDTEQRAIEAEAFAKADYNLTLTNKYGVNDDIFSVGFSVDGMKMQMVQTARDISKIDANTVTYFLLDRGTIIEKTREGLKKQYETKGFSCKESN